MKVSVSNGIAFGGFGQSPIFLSFLLVILLFLISPANAAIGFSLVSVPNLPGDPLQVGIWYPTKSPTNPYELGLITQDVAQDAAVDGTAHPLIVISHGNGGSLENHYDTALALAQAGFVVAAPTHTGDNYLDQSRATHVADRPRAVHAVIGYMLGDWVGRASIDAAAIGMFGFSSGGLTTLLSLGGVPDFSRIPPHCVQHPAEYVCLLIKAHPVSGDQHEAWVVDPRIRAAVIAAPALGFTFSRSGLQNVTVPIQLWRAGLDHILPTPSSAEPVRDGLPRRPEYHVVAGADHFDFLAPCSEALARFVPVICQEHGAFDRAAFHRMFDREVVRFFRGALR